MTLTKPNPKTMAQPSKIKAGGARLDEPIVKEVDGFESLYYKIAELEAMPEVKWMNIYFEDKSGEFVRDRFSFIN